MTKLNPNNHLILYTESFPYGQKIESFLENEIPVISQHFHKVSIIPFGDYNDKIDKRKLLLPKNVEVIDDFRNLHNTIKGKKVTLIEFLQAIKILGFSIFWSTKKNVYFKNLIYYFRYTIGIIRLANHIEKKYDNQHLLNACVYTYWFTRLTTALALLKAKNKIGMLISRAHGYDLYDERKYCNLSGLREFALQHLNKLYVVSKFGENYLQDRLNSKFHKKIGVSYLGVKPSVSHDLSSKTKNKEFTIVSCSNILDFKRVEYIPLILSDLKTSIQWYHFGDGPFMHKVIENTSKLSKNIIFHMMGEVRNEEVLKFYEENQVDLFISMSITEGLPVSMMEAISYGIPVFACDVGGVSEIVNAKTGVSFKPDESLTNIKHLLNEIINNYPFNAVRIQNFFQENFNAENNYKKFINEIIRLTNV